MKRRNTSDTRRGFTLIEMLIVVAIILIIAAVAIPRLEKARMQTMESAAIQQVRTLQTAEVQYFSQFGKFACKLEELGPPASGQPGPAAADLIPGDLAKGHKTGYTFAIQCNAGNFVITAVPDSYNATGRRTFYSDPSNIIRENWGAEPATANSPEIK
jgi:type IV pilus assembly protein PilA